MEVFTRKFRDDALCTVIYGDPQAEYLVAIRHSVSFFPLSAVCVHAPWEERTLYRVVLSSSCSSNIRMPPLPNL